MVDTRFQTRYLELHEFQLQCYFKLIYLHLMHTYTSKWQSRNLVIRHDEHLDSKSGHKLEIAKFCQIIN
jgi:hypothetical protein